jgi:hypothetical protein
MRTSLITALSLLWLVVHGQHSKVSPPITASNRIDAAAVKSALQTAPLYKSIEHDGGTKWAVTVKNRTYRQHSLPEVEAIKAAKRDAKLASYHPSPEDESNTRAVTPVIESGFEANWSTESTPPDNTIAISNGGIIVSANNDGIEYYNENGTNLYFDFWSDFFDDSQLTSSIFDPKVIYDSGADRFIMTVLHGSVAATSRVLMCFSKTNNPIDGWHVYKLSGNPLGNNSWFDFPSLGMSANEVYVSGNLFSGNSFTGAVVFQINKAEGYAGGTLDWQYWSDFFNDPFTIVPASYGQQGNYGPGVYLVSSAAAGDDSYWLWDLTNDIGNNEEFIGYIIPSDEYSPAANAVQSGSTDELDNGDCRAQSAFYLDGIIHFAMHTDIGSGWNGISYNRLSIQNQNVTTSIFGQQGTSDFSYPSLASFATSTSDRSVMIACLRSSNSLFPEVRVVNCDQGMQWSSATLVKSGETFVDFLNDNERWGDYTGIARKHNSPRPIVWMAGAYGANITTAGVNNTYKTWIAEVSNGNAVSTADQTLVNDVSFFPNPVYDMMHLTFNVTEREEIAIALHDINGHLVKLMYRDTPRIGEHRLSFNKGALTPGTYILSITSPTQTLAHEKIVIAE